MCLRVIEGCCHAPTSLIKRMRVQMMRTLLQVLKRLPRLEKIDSDMVTDQDKEAAAKL